jgi:hypothetical protein
MYLSDAFPSQNGLEQGDALPPLLFNSALDYAIRNVQKESGGTEIEYNPSISGLC